MWRLEKVAGDIFFQRGGDPFRALTRNMNRVTGRELAASLLGDQARNPGEPDEVADFAYSDATIRALREQRPLPTAPFPSHDEVLNALKAVVKVLHLRIKLQGMLDNGGKEPTAAKSRNPHATIHLGYVDGNCYAAVNEEEHSKDLDLDIADHLERARKDFRTPKRNPG